MPVPFIYTSRLSFEKGTGRTGGQNSQFYRLILVGSLLQKEPAESCYSTNLDSFHISFVVFHTLDVNVPSKEHYDPVSYDNALNDNTTKPKVNFHTLESDVPDEADFDIMIPIASVDEFSYAQGTEEVLRNGPWMIRGTPIFLNKWSPSVSLTKEELSKVQVPMKNVDTSIDGFQVLKKHGHNRKQQDKIMGFKTKSKILYRPFQLTRTLRLRSMATKQAKGIMSLIQVVLIRTFVINNNGNAMVLANHFDVLNIVVNEEDVTPSSVLGATFAKNGLNRGNNKASDLGADESDSEAEEVYNETTSFMAPKQPKEGPYDDDPYDLDDDDAHEEYIEAQMAFYKKFNKNLSAQARR
ncbi:hypothetical protein Tco_1216960 [Tanacetum coccineum]